MNEELMLGSSMMIKMINKLKEQGWQFTLNDRNIIVQADDPKTGETVKFLSFGHVRMWLYTHALKR